MLLFSPIYTAILSIHIIYTLYTYVFMNMYIRYKLYNKQVACLMHRYDIKGNKNNLMGDSFNDYR